MTQLATVPQTALLDAAGIQQHSGSTAAAQHSMAQIQCRATIALARPRDLALCRAKLIEDCKRPRFAEAARYNVKNRGSGLSIRFAESIARNWNNLYCESIVVDDNDMMITMRVSVTDLESNACITRDVPVEKTVERKYKPKQESMIKGTRFNSYGEEIYILYATSDDTLGKLNAQVSKALRTLLLKFVPFDVLEECEDQIQHTLEQDAKENPDAAKNRVIDAFMEMRVTPDELATYIGKSLARLQPADVVELKSLYAALRDGEFTWEDAVEEKHPPQTTGEPENAMDTKPADDEKPDPEDPLAGIAEELDKADAKPPAKRTRKKAAEKPPRNREDDVAKDAEKPVEPEPEPDAPTDSAQSKRTLIADITAQQQRLRLRNNMLLDAATAVARAQDKKAPTILDLEDCNEQLLQDILNELESHGGER